MNKTIAELTGFFSEYGKVCIAYTCGWENPVLVRAALEAGCGVLAVIAVTPLIKTSEAEYMENLINTIFREVKNGYLAFEKLNIAHPNAIGQRNCMTVEFDALCTPEVAENPHNRCFFCKKNVLRRIMHFARRMKCDLLVDSTYYADEHQIRAFDDLDIINPLHLMPHEQVIRDLSGEGVYAMFPGRQCLADGFCTGIPVTKEGLKLVEGVENILKKFDLTGTQFKIHGDLIRIKGRQGDFQKFAFTDFEGLNSELMELGFSYATVDLSEYKIS